MTPSQPPPPLHVSSAGDLAPRAAPGPRLAAQCEFHHFDAGDGSEDYLLRTPSGRQFRISLAAKQLLESLDGSSSLDEIATRLQTPDVPFNRVHLRRALEPYALAGAIDGWSSEGIAVAGETSPPPVNRKSLPFLLTVALIPARWVGGTARLFSLLFSPLALFAGLVAVAVSHWLLYFRGAWKPEELGPTSYAVVVSLALATIVVHEIGHAAALRRYGGKPGPIGFGLYLLMPTFFADVSEIWRFSRRQRMVVDLGGPYFHQLSFVALVVGYAWTGRAELAAAAMLVDLMVLMSLNPLFRFDGYWLLVDYLAMPRLQQTALRESRGWIRRLFGGPTPQAPRGLHGLRLAVFRTYSLFAAFFLLAVFWLMYRYLSVVIARLPEVVPLAWRSLLETMAAGNVAASIGNLITLFFVVAFPATAAVGVLFYLRRISRGVAQLPWIERLVRHKTLGTQRSAP